MPNPPRELAVVLLVVPLLLALPNVATAAEQARGRGKFEPPPGKAMVLMGCGWDDSYQLYKRLTGDVPAGGTFHYEFNGDTNFFWRNARENVGENGVLHVNFNLISNTGGSLKPYLKGEKDADIKKIGEAFKTWGQAALRDRRDRVRLPREQGVHGQAVRHRLQEDPRMWTRSASRTWPTCGTCAGMPRTPGGPPTTPATKRGLGGLLVLLVREGRPSRRETCRLSHGSTGSRCS